MHAIYNVNVHSMYSVTKILAYKIQMHVSVWNNLGANFSNVEIGFSLDFFLNARGIQFLTNK